MNSLKVRVCISEIITVLLFILVLRGSTNSIEIYLKIALAFLWFVFALLENKYAFMNMMNSKIIVAIVVYLLIRTIISVFISDSIITPINYSLSLVVYFIGIFMMCYYNNRNISVCKLVNILLIIYLWYAIKATIFYLQNPEAARVFSDYQDSVTIGEGYGIAFGAAFLSVFVFALLLNDSKSKKIQKAQYILVIVVGIIVCMLVQSSIIIYALVLGLCVDFIIYKCRKSNASAVGVIFIIIVIFVLFFLYKTDFYELLIRLNISFKNAITDRLAVLARYALYKTESDALTGRVDVYFESIRMFFQHPIIGAASEYSYSELYQIGNHSTILDVFGRYGFVAGVMNVYIYIKYVNDLYLSKHYASKGCLVCLMFMAVLDPITQASAAALIFLLVGMFNVMILQSGDSDEENTCFR